jgi:hypothetical protein
MNKIKIDLKDIEFVSDIMVLVRYIHETAISSGYFTKDSEASNSAYEKNTEAWDKLTNMLDDWLYSNKGK